ncbi:hypothetical protein [Sporosarcina trichiuri]|uniref:hypothetical protein n=1 Tax=Sporosarcina trichiuri TaxID=3056445 RepID=UPI0025B46615|nr:hypothetical protein [Sporosarcina sp. 0.2-SM1T-5]WJY28058.1 hypothetical protein QWT68_03490 [Sporosarcina sp. 0.2-SM1T-5]
MKGNETELPWYLKQGFFLLIAFCFAPLAYLIVILNWKRLDKETRGDRFFVASILFLIFSINFMPQNSLRISLAIGVPVLLWAGTYAVMARRH